MTSSRELLLEASENEDLFLEVLQKNNARDDPFDLEEILPTLDKKLLDKLWTNLQTTFTSVFLSLDFSQNNDDDDKIESFEKSCSLIQGIVTIAMETIHQDDPFIPKGLLETAIVLHGILLSMPDSLDKLKNSISRLCEAWWKLDLMCRLELGTHTITYLLQRSNQIAGTQGDVKRVLQMYEILRQVDFNNESSSELKKLLDQAVISMLYLKCEDGRKFLSHVLNLSPGLTESLHKIIKNHLPWCPRSVLPLYGEVYFKAWKSAAGPNLKTLEKSCIQDFMYHSVLGQPKLSSVLRKVLSSFHRQKTQRGMTGVDEMLVKLYEPILWRYLKVANGQVRLNAVSLLIDAFPLQSPECGMEEKDQMLQKQFDVLKDMLFDPYQNVRATVVMGVCAICSKYWELIPPETIKDQMNCVVSELAYDGASADVRTAVFRGLTELFDNPLAHPMLKTLLPGMSNCFHDTSEKVRIAFVDMLLKAKGIKAIKFWNVVPLDHLLARLELDSPPVARRIVKLLLNSYMPPDKEVDVLVTRCLSLIASNPGAARRFYQYVIPHSSFMTLVRLMAMIMNLLEDNIRKKQRRLSSASMASGSDDSTAPEGDFLESFGEEESERMPELPALDPEDGLLIDNKDTVAGLLEILVILWTGLSDTINSSSKKDMRIKLERAASRCLPQLFQMFQDSRILAAQLSLSGFVPHKLMPTVSRGMLSRLRQMTNEAPAADYAPLLEVMCRWGKVKDVLELISDWLLAGLEGGQDTPVAKTQKSRIVTFAVQVEPQPDVAIAFLCHLLQQKQCRQILFSTANAELREVSDILRGVLKAVEKRMQSPEPLGELSSDNFLEQAFELYLKLEVLLHNKDHEQNAITVTEGLLSWADVELVSSLKRQRNVKKQRKLLAQGDMTLLSEPTSNSGTLVSGTMSETALGLTACETMSSTLLGIKRSAGEGGVSELKEFTKNLIQRLLSVTTNMLLVGIGDRELASHLADFCLMLLKLDTNSVVQLLPHICKLMYQITEMTLTLEADEGVGSQGDLVPGMLIKVIEMIVMLTTHRREHAERILPLVKPALMEMLGVYYRSHLLNQTMQRDVMATLAAAVIVNMSEAIKENYDYEPRKTMQELPLLTSFFVNLMCRRTSLIGLLLGEISQCLNSGSMTEIEIVAGTCHLIYTLTQNKRSGSEMKDCVLSLETQAANQGEALKDTLEDSPPRQLLESCRKMISECKTKLGIV